MLEGFEYLEIFQKEHCDLCKDELCKEEGFEKTDDCFSNWVLDRLIITESKLIKALDTIGKMTKKLNKISERLRKTKIPRV